MAIRFRRGLETEFTSGSNLQTGEPAYCDDTKHFYIGDTSGAVRIADQAYVDTKVATVISGSPKSAYATLAALQSAYPTGTTGIFVVLADNKWYLWTNNQWTAGGTYIGNIGDFNVIAPYCTAAWDSVNSRWVITLPATVQTPASMPDNMLLRVKFTSNITWDANGTNQLMCISGLYAYQLVANVGNAYCGKTLSADTYAVMYNSGKWIIFDAAQKLGCNFANPIYVSSSQVVTQNDVLILDCYREV